MYVRKKKLESLTGITCRIGQGINLVMIEGGEREREREIERERSLKKRAPSLPPPLGKLVVLRITFPYYR